MSDEKWSFRQILNAVFLRHPESIGETYWQHLRFASFSGLRLVIAGVACIIHSIFPIFFEKVASNTIEKLSQEIAARKKSSS